MTVVDFNPRHPRASKKKRDDKTLELLETQLREISPERRHMIALIITRLADIEYFNGSEDANRAAAEILEMLSLKSV